MSTVDDLHRVEGRAELIGGVIVHLGGGGRYPSQIEARIMRGLHNRAEAIGEGEAYTGGIAFVVPRLRSGRQTFSPNTSYYLGPFPANPMSFIEGPPTFAVEVRSENDYGRAAEREMAAKRTDYFEAGTLAIWNVDPVAETVRSYRVDGDSTFARGQKADASPALPGWSMAVDRIFG